MKRFNALLLSSVLLLTGALVTLDVPVYAAEGGHVVVKSGDVFWKIARDAGLTIDGLSALNPQIKNINLIYPGDKIYINSDGAAAAPAAKPASAPAPAATTAPAAPAPAPAAPEPKTFTTTGKGFGGDIQVTTTITDGKITAVKIGSHSETAGISDPAISKLPASFVGKTSADVDTVAGCTMTSKGIIEAVGKALSQAK